MEDEYTQESLTSLMGDEVIDVAKEVVKTKYPRPLRSEKYRFHTEPGDNAKYINHTMALMEFKKPDMTNAELVRQRVTDYFSLCQQNDMKPSIEGMALAFGVDRKALWNWANGHQSKYIPQEARDVIKMAYTAVNSMMADYMQNGKINPIPGIFLMKNNMGYTDQTEIVVTPNNPLGENVTAEEIAEKYAELPEE